MWCRKIRELLKSDYLDTELGEEESGLIKAHLAECASCRKLEEELVSHRELFQGAKLPAPPDRVWQNIRESIVAEQLSQGSFFDKVLARLRRSLFVLRPAIILTGALAMIIFAAFLSGTLTRRGTSLSIQETDVVLYSPKTLSDGLAYDFGTKIEEYFL